MEINKFSTLRWDMANYRHAKKVLGPLIAILNQQSSERFGEDLTTMLGICGEMTETQFNCMSRSIRSKNRFRMFYHALMIAMRNLDVNQSFTYVAPPETITDLEDIQGLITQLSNASEGKDDFISGTLYDTLCPVLADMDIQDKVHTFGTRKVNKSINEKQLNFTK